MIKNPFRANNGFTKVIRLDDFICADIVTAGYALQAVTGFYRVLLRCGCLTRAQKHK